jgi:hypothetical protein
MELVKGAPALNRFVAESVKLPLMTMPHLFEIMRAGVLQTMDNQHIKPPNREGVQPGRFVSKVPHGATMCGLTYRLWGPNELSPNHRVYSPQE